MEGPKRRLATIGSHVSKLNYFKNNGWGYKDTEFVMNEDGLVELTGTRYMFSGKVLPNFRQWAEAVVGLDITDETPIQENVPPPPVPQRNEPFIDAVADHCGYLAFEDEERVFHSHGHSLQEIYALRHGKLECLVDAAIYPRNHEDVEQIVRLAVEHDVVLIPYGGGTNVTQALLRSPEERRMVVAVDMAKMNHVKVVDKDNMVAIVEAGINGQALEAELARYGVCTGHEPDSSEFSTVGGWISTRASGMKKNRYGNIEDIVITMKVVTPQGSWVRPCSAPRVSTGPDLNNLFLGHEGNFGIITEATIKVKDLPEVQNYGSIVFPTFSLGCAFMHEAGRKGLRPASLRLVDNMQFQFAVALKPTVESQWTALMDKVKKYYVTQIKAFDPNQIAVCTVLFEGEKSEVKYQEKRIYALAKKHKGFKGGAENGLRGYFLTYMIAYLRDYAMQYYFMAESFETSVSWENVDLLVRNTSNVIEAACVKFGVQKKPFISSRVTQVYDSGAAVYVYFGFIYKNINNPIEVYTEIEHLAREEIIRCGGSVSHHHGIGKLRKGFTVDAVGEQGVKWLRAIKESLDPKNIFASGNLI